MALPTSNSRVVACTVVRISARHPFPQIRRSVSSRRPVWGKLLSLWKRKKRGKKRTMENPGQTRACLSRSREARNWLSRGHGDSRPSAARLGPPEIGRYARRRFHGINMACRPYISLLSARAKLIVSDLVWPAPSFHRFPGGEMLPPSIHLHFSRLEDVAEPRVLFRHTLQSHSDSLALTIIPSFYILSLCIYYISVLFSLHGTILR